MKINLLLVLRLNVVLGLRILYLSGLNILSNYHINPFEDQCSQ